MQQHLEVYISATEGDLADYRKRAVEVVREMGWNPVLLDAFSPAREEAVRRRFDAVAGADLFVGLYAHHYGERPVAGLRYSGGTCDGETSITHLEYQWAAQRGMPLLLFVLDDDVDWPPDLTDRGEDAQRLDEFLDSLTEVTFFLSAYDLADKLRERLQDMHADTTPDPVPDVPTFPEWTDTLNEDAFRANSSALADALVDWLGEETVDALAAPVPTDALSDAHIEAGRGLLETLVASAKNRTTEFVLQAHIGESARRWLQAALVAARALEQSEAEGHLLSDLGRWHQDRSLNQDALAYYEADLLVIRELANTRGEAATLSAIGDVYTEMSQYDTALSYYQHALSLEIATATPGATHMLESLNSVYWDTQAEAPVTYFQKAPPDRTQEALRLNNLGMLHRARRKNARALDYLKQALAIREAAGQHEDAAFTSYHIGRIYEDLGDLEQAITAVARSVALSERAPHYALDQFRATLGWLRARQQNHTEE